MTESERIARSQRGKAAWDEFFGPMIDDMLAEYGSRLVEVANTELNAVKRADKITALSNAIRIARNLKDGMQAIVTDGELARKDMIRKERVEDMTKPQRRLLGIAPY